MVERRTEFASLDAREPFAPPRVEVHPFYRLMINLRLPTGPLYGPSPDLSESVSILEKIERRGVELFTTTGADLQVLGRIISGLRKEVFTVAGGLGRVDIMENLFPGSTAPVRPLEKP